MTWVAVFFSRISMSLALVPQLFRMPQESGPCHFSFGTVPLDMKFTDRVPEAPGLCSSASFGKRKNNVHHLRKMAIATFSFTVVRSLGQIACLKWALMSFIAFVAFPRFSVAFCSLSECWLGQLWLWLCRTRLRLFHFSIWL